MDRGPLRATVHGVAKSQTQLSPSTYDFDAGEWLGSCTSSRSSSLHTGLSLSERGPVQDMVSRPKLGLPLASSFFRGGLLVIQF